MIILGLVFFSLEIFSTVSADEDLSECKRDLGLVVDTTRSIKESNIPKIKTVLQQLIEKFDVSENGTHVSLETFHNESTLHNTFKNSSFYSNEALQTLISEGINELFKPTRLDVALRTAKYEMFANANGPRPGVQRVLVLFTDGRSFPGSLDEYFFLEVVGLVSKGVHLVVVAVGPDSTKTKYRDVLEKLVVEGKDKLHILDNYTSLAEAASAIAKSICPPNPCKKTKGMDLAFVLDQTESLGRTGFAQLKGFILQIVNALNISQNGTHVGIIMFSEEPTVISTFADANLYSKEAVHNLIDKIPANLTHPTRTDRALMAADEHLFTEAGGDRPDYPNALIIVTDGRTNPQSTPFNQIIPLLKKKMVHIAAVGVGQFELFQKELNEIAGDNVYDAHNFDELPSLFQDILRESCSVDGQYSGWGSWSTCDMTCGLQGLQVRHRACNNPPPQVNGNDCAGDREEAKPCANGPCPSGFV